MSTIRSAEVITCDLGWRTISFLRLESTSGAVGWSEFTESFGSPGLATTVAALAERLPGRAVDRPRSTAGELASGLAPAPGGMGQLAIGAIDNALVELHARELGISVAALFGGRTRDALPVYWSHCGTYRRGFQAKLIGREPYTTYDELAEHGAEVAAAGFSFLKTNLISFDEELLRARPRPWLREPGSGGIGWDDRFIQAMERTVRAFREGADPDMGIMLDANFSLDALGLRRLAERLGDLDLTWLELDGLDADAAADLRASAPMPIATGESVLGAAASAEMLRARAADVFIVDVLWNGIRESLRIAELAQLASIPVAPHNFYGHLSTAISAQFASLVPNLALLEVDIDGVPWRDDLVTEPPRIADGHLALPDGPGWGVDVDERAVRDRAVDRLGLRTTHII